ncbi:VCBS repeat-containing protein [Stackebrandtia soli]|uniref:VCBS repeat-containing protein n=1 Tax=Stackebrandtia soli TaxID=1892856 RepID=UPI0039EC4630
MSKIRRIIGLAAASALATGSLIAVTAAPALAANCAAGVENDFDGDGVRDIALGSPGDTVSGIDDAGAVYVRHSRNGAAYSITQSSVGDSPHSYGHFGMSVDSYDANGDGCSDLVVGAPGRYQFTGAVFIIPGSPNGLVPSSASMYTQNSGGFPGTAEAGDNFGYAVAAGNTPNGQPFLIIGSPGEKIDKSWGEGAIHYSRGGTTKLVHQDSSGVPGATEKDDYFGSYIAATPTHFLVSVYGEAIGSKKQAGQVQLFSHSWSNGIPKPLAAIHQDSSGISGGAESGDLFGASISGIAYRATGQSSNGSMFAVGSPGEALRSNSATAAGAAYTLYVSPSGKVSQHRYYHQDVSGVYGGAESNDRFGFQVTLARTGNGAYATKSTAMLSVLLFGETGGNYGYGANATFRFDTSIGAGDSYIVSGRFGIPANAYSKAACPASSSGSYLVIGNSAEGAYGVPWSSLRAGTVVSNPVRYVLPASPGVVSDGGCSGLL